MQPNSKQSFNGGRSLLGNYFTMQAVPTRGRCMQGPGRVWRVQGTQAWPKAACVRAHWVGMERWLGSSGTWFFRGS